jgi:hypothetical protein
MLERANASLAYYKGFFIRGKGGCGATDTGGCLGTAHANQPFAPGGGWPCVHAPAPAGLPLCEPCRQLILKTPPTSSLLHLWQAHPFDLLTPDTQRPYLPPSTPLVFRPVAGGGAVV